MREISSLAICRPFLGFGHSSLRRLLQWILQFPIGDSGCSLVSMHGRVCGNPGAVANGIAGSAARRAKENSSPIYRWVPVSSAHESRQGRKSRSSCPRSIRTASFVPDGTHWQPPAVTHRWKRWAIFFRPDGLEMGLRRALHRPEGIPAAGARFAILSLCALMLVSCVRPSPQSEGAAASAFRTPHSAVPVRLPNQWCSRSGSRWSWGIFR